MPESLSTLIPQDAFKILVVFLLSFLIGLEREEHKQIAGRYGFGGVRTYPLIGLLGYGMASLSAGQLLPLAAGFLVIGGFMLLSYWHKITTTGSGLTSEVAGLATYLVGALVYNGQLWVATAIAIVSLILLELKTTLEGLTQRFAPQDILTLTQFLFLTIVILPILPNQAFGLFQLNPFKTWLVVVAVSTLSYGSFLLQRVVKGRRSLALTALLGGAYSSTVTTVALAKQSVGKRRPYAYAGSILMASGVMYLRLALLVSLFNPGLRQPLAIALGLLGSLGIIIGGLWSIRGVPDTASEPQEHSYPSRNPLELKAAFLFALLFIGMVILTHYTVAYLGKGGVYTLAGVMGVTDVDPFILGITQTAGKSTSVNVASSAILIAAASNNLVKGVYALGFGERSTGRQSLGLLALLAFIGLMPLVLFQI
jgi:uncharacterized membrane protein (DUF4010 family)